MENVQSDMLISLNELKLLCKKSILNKFQNVFVDERLKTEVPRDTEPLRKSNILETITTYNCLFSLVRMLKHVYALFFLT